MGIFSKKVVEETPEETVERVEELKAAEDLENYTRLIWKYSNAIKSAQGIIEYTYNVLIINNFEFNSLIEYGHILPTTNVNVDVIKLDATEYYPAFKIMKFKDVIGYDLTIPANRFDSPILVATEDLEHSLDMCETKESIDEIKGRMDIIDLKCK